MPSNKIALLVDNLKKQTASANDSSNTTKDTEASASALLAGLADTLAAAKAAFWGDTDDIAEKIGTQYKGDYIATNTRRQVDPNTTWANVPPDPDILFSDVTQLNIEKSLTLAARFDGDIDGKANNSTSSCKEGDESFVFGASYSGTQGISISEVSGLSSSYVRGKRVSWLNGDSWTYQTGGDAHSESDSNKISSKVKAENISSSTTSLGHIKTETTTTLDNTTTRTSQAAINSKNTAKLISEVNLFGNSIKISAGANIIAINTGLILETLNICGIKSEHTLAIYIKKYEKVIGVKEKTTIAKSIIESTKGVSLQSKDTESKMAESTTEEVNFRTITSNQSTIKNSALIDSSLTALINNGSTVSNSASAVTTNQVSTENGSLLIENNRIKKIAADINASSYKAMINVINNNIYI